MKLKLLLVFLCLSLFGCINPFKPINPSAKVEITLAWDANSEEDLAGYKIYYGTSTGRYDSNINVGNVLEFAVKNLMKDVKYYFAATAYNTSGAESLFSNEVNWKSE